MRVSKVYPGNPVGIMQVWWDKCWALHLYTCLRQWRQGRLDGANAFVTQENHESVCAWRATVSILGNGFTCTCPCQDLKFWRFEISVFLKTIMLRPFFGVFDTCDLAALCVSSFILKNSPAVWVVFPYWRCSPCTCGQRPSHQLSSIAVLSQWPLLQLLISFVCS